MALVPHAEPSHPPNAAFMSSFLSFNPAPRAPHAPRPILPPAPRQGPLPRSSPAAVGNVALAGGCRGTPARDEPSLCWGCLWLLQARVSTCLLLHGAHPCSGGRQSQIPLSPWPQLSWFKPLVLAQRAQGSNTDISLHILLLCKDHPNLARARREPQKCKAGWSSFCKSLAQPGERAGSSAPHAAPCSPAPYVLPRSQRSRCQARPSGQGCPIPCLCWVLGRSRWVQEPSRRELWGTKGPLLRSFVCYQAMADAREAPGPAWAPGHVQSPSPQPREPRSSSSPPCSRALPGCGIRGQIRPRFAPATQISWIGKWGWGEEMDPAVPEGGSAWSWGLGREPGAAKGSSSAGMGVLREEAGSCFV